MNEVASSSTPPRPNSASSSSICTICLETCTNKCFSNSCMHQFCYTCLLRWSTVKAECPLCKQPFTSIIHNIESNSEYDEIFITPEIPEGRAILDNNEELYLPPAPFRRFQFRTNFTMDRGGELAIRQMMLSHPLTNTLFGRPHRTRRASPTIILRRYIYELNMWVYAPPDITGRYRDITPDFYRENPAAISRLVPWLKRELKALLRENTQQVMHLVDVTMDHLPRWHIRSRSFRQLLSPYLTNNTEHFIHEFYNFMRSPYDMIGYDLQTIYADPPHSITYLIPDLEDESDFAIANILEPVAVNNNPFRRSPNEVLVFVSDSSHDSDVIIGESPMPEIVLVDSDSDEIDGRTREPPNNNNVSEESCETSDSSTSSNDSLHKRSKRRHKCKKSKSRSHKDHKSCNKEKSKGYVKTAFISDSSSSDNELLSSRKRKMGFDSDDSLPLSKIKSKKLKNKSKKNRSSSQATSSRTHTITSRNSPSTGEEDQPQNAAEDEEQADALWSLWKPTEVGNSTNFEHISSSLAPVKPSTPCNNVPCTCNVFDKYPYQYPESVSQYKCEQYNPYVNSSQNGTSLPQFKNIPHYDTLQQCNQYSTSAHSSPPPIGSRYYDGPDYRLQRNSESYTPLAHSTSVDNNSSSYNNLCYWNDCNCGSSHRDCSGYNCNNNKLLQFYPQQNMELPSRVDVGVGTSPIKNEIGEADYSNYCSGPSSSRHMQSVFVKKEEKENPNIYRYYLNADTSDSDS